MVLDPSHIPASQIPVADINHPLKEIMHVSKLLNCAYTIQSTDVFMMIINVMHTCIVLVGQPSVVCTIESTSIYKTNVMILKLSYHVSHLITRYS